MRKIDNRIDYIDALRGLAAAYVATYHMIFLPNPNLSPPAWASTFFNFGGSGVTLFFIISAFSLCLTMPRRADGSPDLKVFYIRRFFRIAPLFYFAIIATLIRDKFLFGVVHSFSDVIISASFLFNAFPSNYTGFVWASWTISIEMIVYASFPWIWRLCRTISSAVALLFATLLLATIIKTILPHVLPAADIDAFWKFNFFHHLPSFMFGVVAYQVVFGQNSPTLTRQTGAALVLGALYGFHSLLGGKLTFLFSDPLYWQGLLYTILLVGLSACPSPILINPLTRTLGRISYSVYLTHTTVIFGLCPAYKWIYSQPLVTTMKFISCVAITGPCVALVSWGTYTLIEKPGIGLGRRLRR